MFPEYRYHNNPLQDPEVCRDAFGDEVYEGDTVWCGEEGMLPDPGTDNYDSKNPVMDLIVQQLGTRYILEQLGYEKRVIE